MAHQWIRRQIGVRDIVLMIMISFVSESNTNGWIEWNDEKEVGAEEEEDVQVVIT